MFEPGAHRTQRAACIDCAKCAKACPAALPVDRLVQIRSAECTGCLECVAVCPAQRALVIAEHGPPRSRMPFRLERCGRDRLVFFGLVGYAKLSGHWDTRLPKQVYLQLVPAASEQQHPMPQ